MIEAVAKPRRATHLELDESAESELYYFDADAADRACNFIESLRHTQGPLAGKRFILAPWQRQHTRALFGWKRKSDGCRRFRVAYIEVPRKNGKTSWAATIALYMTFADGEKGGQVYSAAKDLDQALLCYDTAVAMVEDHPFLSQPSVTKIRKMPKSINCVRSRTKYRPLAGKSIPGTGFSPSGIIFDELHEQSNRNLWDKLQSGRGARSQPLTIALTTAGFDRSSICWTLHKKARDLIDGKIQDDSFYPVIYAIDDGDDWRDPAVWRKANPNFGTSMREDYLYEEFETTKTEPDFVNTFRRWYLNDWTGQDIQWLSLHEWDEGNDSESLWKEFEGRPCWCGVDLSNVRDATAFVMVFHDHRYEGEGRRYVVLPTIWTPREPITKRDAQDTQQLKNWAQKGYVRDDAGVKDISTDAMERHIVDLSKRFDMQQIAFDPYHAKGLIEALENRGFSVWKFAQTPAMYTQGCKELEVLLGRGDLRHDGNEAMRWMVGNAAKHEDKHGNCMPDKGKSGDKIDGVVAMVMGLSLAMKVERVWEGPIVINHGSIASGE